MWGIRHPVAKLAALVLSLSAGAAGEAFANNWARDHVRQREAAVQARALGMSPVDRARASRPRPEIIGGTLAPPNRWPFQAAMLLAAIPDNYGALFCGGTVIDEEFILTAAHCANFLPVAELDVLTGTQSLRSGGTRRTVKHVRIHPNFDPDTFDFDIALVQLTTPIAGLKPWEKALVITPFIERQLAEPPTSAITTGWGLTGAQLPVALRQTTVPIVERDLCNASKSYDGRVTRRMLCAGYKLGGQDSCQGDSGGPLLVANRAGRFAVLAGIVSWGNGCALPNFYGVYTRVAAFDDWITGSMSVLRGR